MADIVRTGVPAEVLGRNQAIERLKRALRIHGLRVDLAAVFDKPGRVYELLSQYYDRADETGSAKYLYRAKADFSALVMSPETLKDFKLLPFPGAETTTKDQGAPDPTGYCQIERGNSQNSPGAYAAA